ncbi:hypothetical protein M8C21_004953, partial [Ambrosia artemisiifolia]
EGKILLNMPKKHNVPVPVTKKSIYSRDRYLWHLSRDKMTRVFVLFVVSMGDILEDPANEPKKDMYMMSIDPEDVPDKLEYLEIGIIVGIPVSLPMFDNNCKSIEKNEQRSRTDKRCSQGITPINDGRTCTYNQRQVPGKTMTILFTM